MKLVEVYQSELSRKIKLEYIGKVKYTGETFGVDGLTNNVIYDVVFDQDGNIKIIDDSNEDYIYDLNNPKPLDNSSRGGSFVIIEDDNDILIKLIRAH